MLTETNTENQLIKGILIHGPEILEHCLSSDDLSKYISRVDSEKLNYPLPPHRIEMKNWFIPEEYFPNLVEYLYSCCETNEQRTRVDLELELFIKNDMYDLLHVIKYIVDTLRANHVVWGVGRGSSVSSYVLYLIGVHKIDSIKYKLPIEEFFKGEQNG
jgi:DNA polymerase III alpha subunit